MIKRMTALFVAFGLFGTTAAVTAVPPVMALKGKAVTVIVKNQDWPIKGLLSTDPCSIRICVDV